MTQQNKQLMFKWECPMRKANRGVHDHNSDFFQIIRMLLPRITQTVPDYGN